MKHNKGFSLIELLVSIAILSIIMVMVVQFMGTASVSLRRTRKQMDLQTSAIEFREQLSDAMMQATYVRIQAEGADGYKLDTGLQTATVNKKRKRVELGSNTNITATTLVSGVSDLTFVSDNYPSYCKSGSKDLDIYINSDNTLLGRDASGAEYPSTSDDSIRSFRLLSEGVSSGDSYYIKPQYIYIRYQPEYKVITNPGGNDTTDSSIEKEQYIIYHFNNKKIYMYSGEVTDPDTATNDGFAAAVTALQNETGDVGKKDKYVGLLTDLIRELYISVDTEANTVKLSAQLYDSEQPKSQRDTVNDAKYTKYIYDYEDSIVLRNAHSLTVAPNKLYKREVVSGTPESSPEESEP